MSHSPPPPKLCHTWGSLPFYVASILSLSHTLAPRALQWWQSLMEIVGPLSPNPPLLSPPLPTVDTVYPGVGVWFCSFPDFTMGILPSSPPPPYPHALEVIGGSGPLVRFLSVQLLGNL